MWDKFVNEIFDGDDELISFVQRLLGYGISGLQREHVLPILWGIGRNGKDTLLEALKYVLGDLATPVAAEVLLDSGRNPNAATPHTYSLRKRRLAWVNETNESAKLNAGQVKLLTGGGSIPARPLYGKPITYAPRFLLMLMTNHKPGASSEDYALWERVLLIPFKLSFVDEPVKEFERKRDPQLLSKLKAEASGILAWLVRGFLSWQADGLNPPESVKIATNEYPMNIEKVKTI